MFGSKSNLDKESAETPDSENCSRLDNLLAVDRQLTSRRASETSIRRSINSEILPSNVKRTLKETVLALESTKSGGGSSSGGPDTHGDDEDDTTRKKNIKTPELR